MKHAEPASLATWMLEHLTPGGCNQALAGDLLEELRAGRSTIWYWRQIFSAIAIRSMREFRLHCKELFFAVLWSMLAPAWLLILTRFEPYAHLNESFSRMNWPWSTICDLGFLLAANLLFVWTGVVLYLFPDLWLAGNLRLRELTRGIAASVPALLVLWLTLIVLPKHFIAVNGAEVQAAVTANTHPSSPERLAIAHLAAQRAWAEHDGLILPQTETIERRRTAAPVTLTDLRLPAFLARLPFFLVVLCSLWSRAQRNCSDINAA